MLGNFSYCNPTKLYFGENSLSNLSDELKKYLPNYEKNISLLEDKQINYLLNEDIIKKAIEYSKKVLEYCNSSNTDNPSTRIHEMVEKLLLLKKSKKELLK